MELQSIGRIFLHLMKSPRGFVSPYGLCVTNLQIIDKFFSNKGHGTTHTK